MTALARKSEQNSFNRPTPALFIFEGLGAPVKNNMVFFRAPTIDFWQARLPYGHPLHWHTATAAVVFYFSKSSQGPSLDCLDCLASRGSPAF